MQANYRPRTRTQDETLAEAVVAMRELMANAEPPYDAEAERCVLASAMAGGRKIASRAVPLIDASDFYGRRNAKIWSAIIACWERGEFDHVDVAAELASRGELAKCGGAQYMLELREHLATSVLVASYANTVRQNSHRRKCIAAASDLAGRLFAKVGSPDDVLATTIAELQRAMEDVSRKAPSAADLASLLISGVQQRRVAPAESEAGFVWTGVRRFDDIFGPMLPRQLCVVAGRPGHGKSAFALQCAINVASRGQRALFFTLEMEGIEQVSRGITMATGLSTEAMLSGFVPEANDAELLAGMAKMPAGLLFSSARTLAAIRAECQVRKAEEAGLQLAVVDYLQLVDVGPSRAPRHEQVAEISRGLKRIADDCGIVVIACAQLNRDQENRAKLAATTRAKAPPTNEQRLAAMMPRVSDLRESGQIEQDAHRIIFVLRPCKQDPVFPAEEAYLKVEKNRNGPEQTLRTRFDLKRFAFGAGLLAESEAGGEWAPPDDSDGF